MPIKPPNLDDRRYADIVREARALIPQYCPEWTNLGDADPGMTLVQLFAWMTEMTIFRLNRVPDKTYIHFLNFIGEERREARPARLVVTFRPNHDDGPVELPAFSRVSTRQQTGVEALRYLTTDRLTVHHCGVERVVVVEAGEAPSVREIPLITDRKDKQVLMFGSGKGLSLFEMDPSVDGVASYTPSQYLYVGHDDFAAMDFELEEGMTTGRVRLRTATDENLPIAGLFRWERFNGEDRIPVDMAGKRRRSSASKKWP